jgi:hypothetical protein
MSFMALWGGLFIFYSSFINTYASFSNQSESELMKQQRYLRIAAVVYFFVHIALSLIFGRWANDFVHNRPNMTLVAASMRTGRLVLPNLEILNDGSSLLIIGTNLFVVSYLIKSILFPKNDKRFWRNLVLISIAGLLLMVLSSARVYLHPVLDPSESSNILLGIIFSIFLGNPYPMIPYLAYGLFGMVLGALYARGKMKVLVPIAITLSIFFIVYGILGIGNHDKTISTPDYFWYYKTQVELGLFMLLFLLALSLGKFRFAKIPIIGWFSRVSLSVYMLETLISELIRVPILKIIPDWNQTINGSLLFGGINVLLWLILVSLWKQIDFRYSLEYWWVKGFARLGKESSKLTFD